MDEILKERMLKNLKQAVSDHWGGWDDAHKTLREIYLTDLNGACMPYEFIGEDVLKEIEDKFYFFLGAIRDELPQDINIYITPSYEDTTVYLMILDDKLLLKDYQKAWHFWFESEEKLMDEMYSIYRRLLAKSVKTYECYTLCRGDIEEVAERKGLDLELRDLDDVIDYVKKGIEGALDNIDEIIEQAIRQADYEPSTYEMLKKEGRNMGIRGCQ
jgi:hypothetical protein